jgi:hypothetical protein
MCRKVLAYNFSVHSGTDQVLFEEKRGDETDGQLQPHEYIQEQSAQRNHQVQRRERRGKEVTAGHS